MMVSTRRRNRKRKQNGVRNNINNISPSTTALAYSGPLTMPQEQLSVVDLCFDAPVTSTAGGVIADAIQDNPNASPDWVNVAATFAEFRILAMLVRFIPNVTGATQGTLLYAPFYVVLDLSSNFTFLASYSAASNYPIARVKSLNEPWDMSHRMRGVEEATFASIGVMNGEYSFKTFASGLTPSTVYGRIFVRWKCQFRGRL